MGRNYINIGLFQQFNPVKKLTGGGYLSSIQKPGIKALDTTNRRPEKPVDGH